MKKKKVGNDEMNQKDNSEDALKNEIYEDGQSTSTVAAWNLLWSKSSM